MILIFIDDVMRTPKGSPLYQGTALYHVLKESKKVVLLAKDKDDAERWLKTNGIPKFDELLDHSYITPGDNNDLRLVEYCRSQGKIELVVTADIELSKYLLEQGIHTLMFLHPSYIRPEFRPDGRGRKAWDAVVQELDHQQELYADDRRIP